MATASVSQSQILRAAYYKEALGRPLNGARKDGQGMGAGEQNGLQRCRLRKQLLQRLEELAGQEKGGKGQRCLFVHNRDKADGDSILWIPLPLGESLIVKYVHHHVSICQYSAKHSTTGNHPFPSKICLS